MYMYVYLACSSVYMQGSKQLYRVVVHPFLLKHEERIDQYITKVRSNSWCLYQSWWKYYFIRPFLLVCERMQENRNISF